VWDVTLFVLLGAGHFMDWMALRGFTCLRCAVIHSYVRRDSFLRCAVIHLYVGRDFFFGGGWGIVLMALRDTVVYRCAMTHPFMGHDLFFHVV